MEGNVIFFIKLLIFFLDFAEKKYRTRIKSEFVPSITVSLTFRLGSLPL